MKLLKRNILSAILLTACIVFVALVCTAFGVFDPPVGPFEGEFDSPEINLDKWQVDDSGACAFERVSEPVRSGSFALRIDSQSRARCEVLPWVGSTILGRQQREPFNRDRWYAFSVFLPGDWEPNPANEVIAQWHSSKDVFFGEEGGRGPPLALRIVGREWRLTAGYDADLLSQPGAKASRIVARRALRTRRWVDWVFRVRWSWKDNGITEVWMDGEPVYSKVGPNAYFDLRGVYLKLGSYHPGQPRTVYLDRVRVQSAPFEDIPIRR